MGIKTDGLAVSEELSTTVEIKTLWWGSKWTFSASF
jgi:hypothetical protein